jgi:tRNA(fMet)-specific endonuclease VapC
MRRAARAMRYLLDTNIFVAALNDQPKVREALNALDSADEVLLSVIVWAELQFGALCSSKREENLARVEALRAAFPLVEITRSVADRFSRIKAFLRKKGAPKSDLDLLIAATAIESDAILITDDKGISATQIPDLATLNWVR